MMMTEKAGKLFKAACMTVIAGAVIAGYTFIDHSFWRGFGEEEFVILVIFCIIFDTALLYAEGYLLCRKLQPPGETAEEPLWFRRLFMAAFSPPVLILLFGLINGATEVFTLFSENQFLVNFFIGVIVALILLLLFPVIPAANLVIILYIYRKNKRRKIYS